MSRIFHLSIIITTLFIIPTVSLAFAAETAGEYIDRKAEIWNLFFRMMTVAFVVGGVIESKFKANRIRREGRVLTWRTQTGLNGSILV